MTINLFYLCKPKILTLSKKHCIMYAIVDIAGQQFKVEKDQKLFVHRLEGEEGKKVSFDKVLLIDTGSKVSVGDPVVKGCLCGCQNCLSYEG